jgi:hypothetical protein
MGAKSRKWFPSEKEGDPEYHFQICEPRERDNYSLSLSEYLKDISELVCVDHFQLGSENGFSVLKVILWETFVRL